MANVTLPAGGSGSTTPIVSTDSVSADSSNVQNVQLVVVSAGVLTRLLSGHGTAAGALRVELPTDGTGIVGLATGANTIGAVTQASGPWTSNITQVAGASIAQGHGTAASAIRVELPTDGTGVVNAAQSGTWTVQPGNTANTTPWLTANYDQTGTIYNGSTAITVSRAAIAAASSGDNTLVSADATHKIRVTAMHVIAAAAVNLYFTDGAAGTVLFGGSTNKINVGANGGFVLPYNPHGWFETSSNKALVMNLSGATAVSGGMNYLLV